MSHFIVRALCEAVCLQAFNQAGLCSPFFHNGAQP